MIRDFFYLQKSDRKVILTLLGVIVVALGIIFLTGGEQESEAVAGDSLPHGQKSADKVKSYYYVAPKHVERFAFDPNTADSTQLLRLGLQPWQVRNI